MESIQLYSNHFIKKRRKSYKGKSLYQEELHTRGGAEEVHHHVAGCGALPPLLP
jgi:hypothetical protein